MFPSRKWRRTSGAWRYSAVGPYDDVILTAATVPFRELSSPSGLSTISGIPESSLGLAGVPAGAVSVPSVLF